MAILLRTPRLDIIPLTAAELDMLLHDLPALERRLAVDYRGEPIEGYFKKTLMCQHAHIVSDPENAIWQTLWLIVRREDGVVVGACGFKSPPDSAGTVEIGYGLGDGFYHNGYMTETVRTMCRYAFSNNKVTRIIAVTEISNLMSMRLLARCGFRAYCQGEYMWWYIDRGMSQNAITNQ